MNTSSKKILIVGASRGLRLGLARQYVSLGWQVTATARTDVSLLAPVAAESGERLSIEHVDITDDGQVAALHQRFSGKPFDVVFVNAGIMGERQKPFLNVTADEVSRIYLTNAFYPARFAEIFADLVKPGGVLAFMSSLVGSIGLNQDGEDDAYRASKAALNMLSRSFFIRNKSRGYAVVVISPGWVRTAMGGPNAPMDIETSVRAVADVVNGQQGEVAHKFLRFDGSELPW